MDPINLGEYEAFAREGMEPSAWDYYGGGSDDEVTLRATRAAYERIQLRPRMLVDVSHIDLTTTALGAPISMPILVAPTALHRLAHDEGECATARGAGAADTLMVVSTLATQSLEAVAEAATGPLWFQLYVYRDRAVSESLARRAEAVGYRALVLTVDTPRPGRRERDMRNSLRMPPGVSFANFVGSYAHAPGVAPGESGLSAYVASLIDPSLTWEALEWLKSVTRMPIAVKGVLTAEDARLAVEHGADAIIVSNHGGRQLDGAPPTIDVLAEVVDAVGGRCEVYLDGGIRRGTDALKALALGARAVLVGRPVLWGLAASGDAGVRHVLDLLRAELELAMALAGRPTLASLDRSVVRLP